MRQNTQWMNKWQFPVGKSLFKKTLNLWSTFLYSFVNKMCCSLLSISDWQNLPLNSYPDRQLHTRVSMVFMNRDEIFHVYHSFAWYHICMQLVSFSYGSYHHEWSFNVYMDQISKFVSNICILFPTLHSWWILFVWCILPPLKVLLIFYGTSIKQFQYLYE